MPDLLDQKLQTYAETASVRSQKLEWSAFSVAATASLAMVPAADAAVIYSGPVSIVISTPASVTGTHNSSAIIDLNGDLQNDLRLFVAGTFGGPGYGGGYGPTIHFHARAAGQNGGQVVNGGGGYGGGGYGYGAGGSIVKFALGNPIPGGNGLSSTGRFATTNGGYPTGGFLGNGFMGARFQIGTQTHNGWVAASVNASGGGGGSITVNGWAYESTPGASISAGAVPEPSTLLMLATGVTGLAAYRRGRKRVERSVQQP